MQLLNTLMQLTLFLSAWLLLLILILGVVGLVWRQRKTGFFGYPPHAYQIRVRVTNAP